MRLPDYTLTLQEPLLCVKPGRRLLFRLCLVALCVIGIPAITGLIWAEVTSFNLNSLPFLPRIALAAAAALAAFGLYRSIQEQQAELVIQCYRDRLILSYDARPSLWRSSAQAQSTEILYKDVQRAIFSPQRCRMTLVAKRYTRSTGDGPSRQKSGAVSFSTLGAPELNLASVLEKHTPLTVIAKN